MRESYENLKTNQRKINKNFNIDKNQSEAIIIVNCEIKGFEMLLNPEIYREFHEKILKSYIIDSKIENTPCSVNIDAAGDVITKAFDSVFQRDNIRP